MALDMGPQDGDFVRYVQTLNSAGGGEPGRVYKGVRGGPARWTLPRIASSLPAGIFTPADDTRTTTTAQAPAPITTAAADSAPAPTLAAKARKRSIAALITLAGAGIAFSAVNRLVGMRLFEQFEPDQLVQPVLFFFFAVMLFKTAARLRRQADKPAQKLPPLSTVGTAHRTSATSAGKSPAHHSDNLG